jgi:hypothetical protein
LAATATPALTNDLDQAARSGRTYQRDRPQLQRPQQHDFPAFEMIDKSEAARRQIECAIRLIAAHEDELAVHTIAMAAFGILNDLTVARSLDYDVKFKPFFTKIGWSHLTNTANFLKHADRDPDAILASLDARENDWRIGFCILLYRALQGTFTTTMAAFHCWMIIRHPDQFQLAEDDDKEIEEAYRDSICFQRSRGGTPKQLFSVSSSNFIKRG